MGVAKPAMPVGEGTMVGAVIDVARSAGLDPVVVVTGFHRDEVAEAVGDTASLVHNPEAASGNMSSLLVGLGEIGDADITVVLLSDMPLVEASTIEALCRELVASEAMCGWTQYTDGRGHPIAFAPRGIEAIDTLSGTKALWPFFDSLEDDERYELFVDEARPLDINTPADYQNLTTQRSPENGERKTENPPP
ncbi:MAG: nucleotidyltransferase family protein [Actinomycetia bacterium]|nr:nucleotidyltransferase family protein [Actinomycetes bacterium]